MYKSFSDHGKKTSPAASIMTQQTVKKGAGHAKSRGHEDGNKCTWPCFKTPDYVYENTPDGHN
jgi:hypothetical protein